LFILIPSESHDRASGFAFPAGSEIVVETGSMLLLQRCGLRAGSDEMARCEIGGYRDRRCDAFERGGGIDAVDSRFRLAERALLAAMLRIEQ
jgi:hypothetical protein